MYFRSSIRPNPVTGQLDSYYRLIESYRNEQDRVCHRTLLNVGFLSGMINVEELNQVRRIICKRYQDIKGGDELFDIEDNNPQKVIDLADKLWTELVKRNRIDIGQKQKKEPAAHQRNMVYEESIRHPDVREIGGEWLSYQALEQLRLADFLSNTGFFGRRNTTGPHPNHRPCRLSRIRIGNSPVDTGELGSVQHNRLSNRKNNKRQTV